MRGLVRSAFTFTKVMVVVWAVGSAAGVAAMSMVGNLGSAMRVEGLITGYVGSVLAFVWLSIAFLYWPLTRLKPAAWVVWLAVNGAVVPLAFAMGQGRSSPATAFGVAAMVFVCANLALYVLFGVGWRLIRARRRRVFVESPVM